MGRKPQRSELLVWFSSYMMYDIYIYIICTSRYDIHVIRYHDKVIEPELVDWSIFLSASCITGPTGLVFRMLLRAKKTLVFEPVDLRF